MTILFLGFVVFSLGVLAGAAGTLALLFLGAILCAPSLLRAVKAFAEVFPPAAPTSRT